MTNRLFAGAKEVTLLDRYRDELGHRPFRPGGGFRLVLLPHQAVLLHPQRLLRLARQFRPRHPPVHGPGADRLLPARQQVFQGDAPAEGPATEDDGVAGEIRRRQAEDERGGDGPLQAGEGQPHGRLPAHRRADPGVLRALQGAVRVDRDAPGAVLRLDTRPVRARPDQPVQPVRAAAVHPAGVPRHRRVAAADGADHGSCNRRSTPRRPTRSRRGC